MNRQDTYQRFLELYYILYDEIGDQENKVNPIEIATQIIFENSDNT